MRSNWLPKPLHFSIERQVNATDSVIGPLELANPYLPGRSCLLMKLIDFINFQFQAIGKVSISIEYIRLIDHCLLDRTSIQANERNKNLPS